MDIKEFENKIILGDCIEELKKFPDNSIDLIFADPPYFMQTEGDLIRPEGSKFAGVESIQTILIILNHYSLNFFGYA